MMLDTARMAFEKGVENIRREFDLMDELINETQGKRNDIMKGGFDDDMLELLYSMIAAFNLARKRMMKMNRSDIPEPVVEKYEKMIPVIDEMLEAGKNISGGPNLFFNSVTSMQRRWQGFLPFPAISPIGTAYDRRPMCRQAEGTQRTQALCTNLFWKLITSGRKKMLEGGILMCSVYSSVHEFFSTERGRHIPFSDNNIYGQYVRKTKTFKIGRVLLITSAIARKMFRQVRSPEGRIRLCLI